MINNLIDFFFINLATETTVSAKITSSKQLLPTKTTYANFLNILEAKSWKKALINNLYKKNCKKLMNFLILQKHINTKKNSFQPIGYPDACKTKVTW